MTPTRPSVTALRERPRGRVEVELDGVPWRLLPADAVVRANLGVGRTLDRETARALARALRRSQALARATRALAARDRSRDALDARLARAGVPAAARDEALGALERAGLVDDARLARSRAGALAANGRGDAAIRADLERQGVAAELVEEVLAALEPERERAARLLAPHGGDARQLRRLASRGFDPDVLAELGGIAETG